MQQILQDGHANLLQSFTLCYLLCSERICDVELVHFGLCAVVSRTNLGPSDVQLQVLERKNLQGELNGFSTTCETIATEPSLLTVTCLLESNGQIWLQSVQKKKDAMGREYRGWPHYDSPNHQYIYLYCCTDLTDFSARPLLSLPARPNTSKCPVERWNGTKRMELGQLIGAHVVM